MEYNFYSWYIELEEQEKRLEYLINNVGSSKGISYDYRGGKTNKIYSIVENEAEKLERLKEDYWDITKLILIVNRAILDTIYFTNLGYKIVKAKLENKDIKEAKGRNSLKACKEEEQKAIKYIKEYLDQRGIKYLF